MNIKQLSERLIKDLQKAAELSQQAQPMGNVTAAAKSIPPDIAIFGAEAAISAGLINLRGTISQLLQLLGINPGLLGMIRDRNNITEIASLLQQQSPEVEKTLEKLVSPTMIDLVSGETVSSAVGDVLENLHSEVAELYRIYQTTRRER